MNILTFHQLKYASESTLVSTLPFNNEFVTWATYKSILEDNLKRKYTHRGNDQHFINSNIQTCMWIAFSTIVKWTCKEHHQLLHSGPVITCSSCLFIFYQKVRRVKILENSHNPQHLTSWPFFLTLSLWKTPHLLYVHLIYDQYLLLFALISV